MFGKVRARASDLHMMSLLVCSIWSESMLTVGVGKILTHGYMNHFFPKIDWECLLII